MTKRLKPSLTSQSCQQHISSPTSTTNIDISVDWLLIDLTNIFENLIMELEKDSIIKPVAIAFGLKMTFNMRLHITIT